MNTPLTLTFFQRVVAKQRFAFPLLCMLLCQVVLNAQPDYVWHQPSQNSSESMPCGGGDVGMNVWVEDGDILFYLSRSGSFDENNTLLKQGRFRLRFSPNPLRDCTDFKQILHLKEGYVSIAGGGVQVILWVDVYKPVVHVEVNAHQSLTLHSFYENWRMEDRSMTKVEAQQCSYKWILPKNSLTTKDSVYAASASLTFFHRNPERTVFDFAVEQQQLEAVRSELYNPIKGLTFGGSMTGDIVYSRSFQSTYLATPYTAWEYVSRQASRKHHLQITLHTGQEDLPLWKTHLQHTQSCVKRERDKLATRKWWNAYWERSFIRLPHSSKATQTNDSLYMAYAEAFRNYALFRYMLGCNAHAAWPTKFNGGLFTFDPRMVDEKTPFTPDFRRWGGGTHTAQNQRLVYWGMLKSGDSDLMKPQFDYYLRILPTAEARSRFYWGHPGACFVEQLENFGLPNPAEYGNKRPPYFDPGMEYNAWLEYQWDTVLEFCLMILETESYAGADITPYLPLIESSLTFFDEHYRFLARRRGRQELDGEGKLVLFPGSACETYKMAYNAASTVAALRSLLEKYGRKNEMLQRLPAIPLHTVEGKEMIAPARLWERVNNTETPQLYPVFPWRIYGVGKEGLETARNTYFYDADACKFRSHIGWKQDNIWAACLGLTKEAERLTLAKLANGPHRFPAFWGPGYDWTPDHNWGGSGMIGLQEMLLQEADGKLLLLPAWDKDRDVHFRLHASGQTIVELELVNGVVTQLIVTPREREKDIVILTR